MTVRDDRGDVKQTTTGFRGPLMVQSLTSAKSKFLSLKVCIALQKEVFSDLFGPQLEALAKEREANAERAKRIANMFKYLCPSYYLPGKQKWGAF